MNMIQGHKQLFLCIIAFLVSIRVSAYDFQIDGFYYNIIGNDQVEVTSGDTMYSGQLSIPGSVTYNGVSYTVTRIGKSAFRGCINLRDVTISKEISLIDSHAFRDCTSLRSVMMQDGVKEISTSAFSGCSYLESLTLSNSITKIGDFAFFNCSGLSSLPLPEQLVTIGKSVFSGCSGLISISLPDNVSTIGDHAFGDCLGITEVTIPQNVTSAGSELFSGCNNLVSINVDSRNTVYDSRDNSNAIIETLSNTLVNGCKSTTIPNSVTRIGYAAFSNCKSLSSITIPKSITSIGSSAFVGCTNLRSVISEVKVPFEISSNVFPSDAYSKGTLTVSIGTIEAYKSTNYWNSFSNIVEAEGSDNKKRVIHVAKAGTLSELISDDEKYTIEELTLTGELNGTDFRLLRDMAGNNYLGKITSGMLTILDMTNAKVVAGGEKYLDTYHIWFSEDEMISIDNSRYDFELSLDNEIPPFVFSCCKLKIILIPNSVTTIGDNAFYRCSGLTSLTLSNSVTTVGDNAFNQCRNLTSLTLSNSLTTIGNFAFEDCRGLTSLTLPNSVTTIGDHAFDGCSGLTSLSFPNSVATIGDYAFYYCIGLTSLTLPASLTTLGKSAFARCSALNSLTFSDNLTIIGESAFYGCI